MTPVLTLLDAPRGTALTLVGSGTSERMTRRLAELGLRRGATLEVMQRTAGGGRVVSVAGGRIALDAAVAAALTATPAL